MTPFTPPRSIVTPRTSTRCAIHGSRVLRRAGSQVLHDDEEQLGLVVEQDEALAGERAGQGAVPVRLAYCGRR